MTVDCRLSTVDSSYKLQEPVKEIHSIVRSGPRLRVVLHRRARDVLQDQSFHGAVVQVQVRQLRGTEVGLPAHRLVDVDGFLARGPGYCEAVVLGRDVDLAAGQVL